MKFNRQTKIIDLVRQFNIETQDELAERLKDSGFEVTQATISRDIRELKLTKIPGEGGRQKYSTITSGGEDQLSERFITVFREAVISMDNAQNILVIKTLDGMAMAVAAALDAMKNREIMGSIAGDNTIICVLKTEAMALRLIDRLKLIIRAD